MKPSIEIKTVLDLPPGIEALRIEASSAGFRFMEKLTKEWETQTNRFDKPGELLAGAFQNGQLVAIGGLNIDPYAGDITIARLRHLYVLKRIRRQGVASRLARYLLDKAPIRECHSHHKVEMIAIGAFRSNPFAVVVPQSMQRSRCSTIVLKYETPNGIASSLKSKRASFRTHQRLHHPVWLGGAIP